MKFHKNVLFQLKKFKREEDKFYFRKNKIF